MIKAILVCNFQSHKRTRIRLHKGVNVFQGSSDSGKTALAVRAVKWVVMNRPTGDLFRSHWGGKTRVRLTFFDNSWVERLRAKNKNEYRVHEKGKTSSYTALGHGIPEPVVKKLNFHPELNFQFQMDPPFLLSCSSGEVAKKLNEVADVGKIDSSLSNINSMIRKNKAQRIAKGQEIVSIQTDLLSYEGLDSLLDKVKSLEETQKNIELLKRKQSILIEVLKSLKEYSSILKGMADITKEVELLKSAEELDKQRATLHGKSAMLSSAIELYTQLENELANQRQRIKDLEKLWIKTFPKYCPLCGKSK